jgi:hypothetical protein
MIMEQILPGQVSFTTQIESAPSFGQKKPQALQYRCGRTASELFIAGLQTWDRGLQRVVNSRDRFAD